MEAETISEQISLQEIVDQNEELAEPVEVISPELSPEDFHQLTICPFRGVSSKSTIADESEEFPEPVDPLKRLEDLEETPLSKRSFAEIYVNECHKYGVTPLQYVCDVFQAVEQNPEELVDVDLNVRPKYSTD